MRPTSQNRVDQAAPIAPYRGINARLRIILNPVAPTRPQVLTLSRPDAMRTFDNRKLIKNRDNRPYLDGVYYQVAVLEQERDSINDAILN